MKDRINRHGDADIVVHHKTDRAYLEHQTTVGNQHPLDAMRLRIRQPINVAHDKGASGALIDRHAPNDNPTPTPGVPQRCVIGAAGLALR